MKLSANSLYGEMSKKISFFAAAIDEIRVRVEAEIDFSDEGQIIMMKTCGFFVGPCV